jgi:hypothetical protein
LQQSSQVKQIISSKPSQNTALFQDSDNDEDGFEEFDSPHVQAQAIPQPILTHLRSSSLSQSESVLPVGMRTSTSQPSIAQRQNMMKWIKKSTIRPDGSRSDHEYRPEGKEEPMFRSIVGVK